MKIKTLKIKVENNNQEFDFNDFFEGSNTIYKTEASLQKEKDGYYWHAFITYEPKTGIPYYKSIPQKETILPEGFKEEIMIYISNNPTSSTRAKNTISSNMEKVFCMYEFKDFYKLRNLGKKSFEKETDFFKGILDIVKKYNKN
jgi:hypothetical protein